jgi:uncharacterized protein YndB with AHSA1/START domain
MAKTTSETATVSLPTDEQMLITREFDAPRELVFRAYTTPELVKRWWHANRGEMKVAEIDLRVGGRWRYVIRERDMEVGFHGEYREIERPHRLVATEAYEGIPDPDANAALNILTLDEVDGVTTMTILVQHKDKEGRDAVIASGMESGMQVSYDRLEDLVRSRA